jgi:hypothetical protein
VLATHVLAATAHIFIPRSHREADAARIDLILVFRLPCQFMTRNGPSDLANDGAGWVIAGEPLQAPNPTRWPLPACIASLVQGHIKNSIYDIGIVF